MQRKRTTIIEPTAPFAAGGLCAAVINGRLRISAWADDREIAIELTASEIFQLRHFLNLVIDASMTGASMPPAFLRGRL